MTELKTIETESLEEAEFEAHDIARMEVPFDEWNCHLIVMNLKLM
nr:hypothetical protein [Staphylococcus aureus]